VRFPEARLGSVTKIVNGGTPDTKIPAYWNGGIAWLTPKDMGRSPSSYSRETSRTISEAGLNDCSARLVPPNSVILSTRAPIGHLAINQVEMAFNQGCRGLVPSEKLETKFLYYFLQANIGLLNDLGTGTTFRELSAGALANVQMPLPPLSEQQRIVAILDEAFEGIDIAIANARASLEKTEHIRAALEAAAFDADRQANWHAVRLGEIASFRNGLNYKKSSTGETVPVVGVADFERNFTVQFQTLNRTQIDGALSTPDLLAEGDILMVRSNGSKSLIGRTMLVGSVKERTGFSGFAIRTRLHSNEVSPEYLCHYLKSADVRATLVASGAGANISSLSQGALADLMLPYPPKAEQADIILRLEAGRAEADRLAETYRRKIYALAELKQSLLARAFSGELTREPLAA